jgi:hypothetical protein
LRKNKDTRTAFQQDKLPKFGGHGFTVMSY